MSLKDIEERLKTIENSLMDSAHSFIDFARLSPSQIESFYLLLNNFYRHGLETTISGQGTNYSKHSIIQRLQEELAKYK